MAGREELTARYQSTVQTLAVSYEVGHAREQARRILMNHIAAEASRQQDLVDEIHDSEASRG